MPDSLISQFSRVFNSPIETNRQLATTTERNNIPSGVRWEGMIVYVVSEQTSYQLVGGVDNGSWELLGGLQDAPSDGQTYGRRNGNWELISSGGIQSVVAGDNITVDDTDPENPVVSAPDVVVKSSDSGTTGLVLKGNGSGTYTFSTQEWEWSRSGDIVYWSMRFTGIDGNTPTGEFQIDIGATTIPSISTPYSVFGVITSLFPINYYSIQSRPVDADTVRLQIQDTLDGSNQKPLMDVDFTGVTILIINGSYITND